MTVVRYKRLSKDDVGGRKLLGSSFTAQHRDGIHEGIKIKIEKKRLSYKNIFSIVAWDLKTRRYRATYHPGEQKKNVYIFKTIHCTFVEEIRNVSTKNKNKRHNRPTDIILL